jgi:hypothetical protein
MSESNFVPVQIFVDRLQALIAKDLLDKAGIPNSLTDPEGMDETLLFAFKGIALSVQQEDIEKAKEVLKDVLDVLNSK